MSGSAAGGTLAGVAHGCHVHSPSKESRMNKKMWFTSLAAAAAIAAGGVALAQTTANPPTSTPGAGCTATGNAMRGGNLGGAPMATGCPQGATAGTAAVAPAPAPATASTSGGSATMHGPADTGTSSTTASSGATHHMASTSSHRMTHVARADRN
jgi:hypothetical protein